MRRLAIVLVLALPLTGCGIALPGVQRKEQIHQQQITNALLACLLAERYDGCSKDKAARLIEAAAER